MSEMSNYLENALLDHVLNNTSLTSPSTVWLALFTADPGETGSLTNEVTTTGTAYARQVASFGAASSGTSTSDADIEFPQATASYGTVSHVGIMDNATAGAGNMLFYTSLTTSKTIDSGDIFKVTSTNLTVTLD